MLDLFPKLALKPCHDLIDGELIAFGDNRRALVLPCAVFGNQRPTPHLIDLEDFTIRSAQTVLASAYGCVLAANPRVDVDVHDGAVKTAVESAAGGEIAMLATESEPFFVLRREDRSGDLIGFALSGRRVELEDYEAYVQFFDRWSLTIADGHVRRALFMRAPQAE